MLAALPGRGKRAEEWTDGIVALGGKHAGPDDGHEQGFWRCGHRRSSKCHATRWPLLALRFALAAQGAFATILRLFHRRERIGLTPFPSTAWVWDLALPALGGCWVKAYQNVSQCPKVLKVLDVQAGLDKHHWHWRSGHARQAERNDNHPRDAEQR